MDPVTVNKKPIICMVTESWQTIDMLFMLPGLIIWVSGAIWCYRKNNIHGALILQVLGALEIVIGGMTAFILAMRELAMITFTSGGYDPEMMFIEVVYYSEIPIIGLIIHLVLLAITLTLVIRAKKNKSRLLPTDNNP